MHKVPVVLLLSLSIILFNVDLSAQVIFVDHNASGADNGSSWTNAFPDLQQALSIAEYGDQIWLAEGHYYPTQCNTCSESDREKSFVIPDGVALYGGFTGIETNLAERDWENHATFLDGDLKEDNSSFNNSYTIVYTKDVSAATIVDGLRLINGNANDMSSLGSRKASGGAWFNESSSINNPSSPTIRNCIFKDNKANGFGGALCNKADFSGKCISLIENVQFIDNEAKEGGGIFNDGSHQGICNPTIRNCTFLNNDVDQFGGGISNDGAYTGESNPKIENCTFTNNSCDSGGGAISNRGYDNGVSNPEIIGSVFIDNHSGAIGGAILNFGIDGDASPTITRCQFKFNFASTYGGSLYNHGKQGSSSPKISNCLFYKNEAYSCAGMYNLGSNLGNASPEITNCTFFGNLAKYGTCIYNNAGSSSIGNSSPIITNCIFWKNIATQISDAHIFRNVSGTPTISHSLVDADDCALLNSGTGANTVTCNGGMIYNQEPKFADTLIGNFHLLGISPAKDMGDNGMMEEYFDLDYNLRLINNTIDLGVFEYGSMPYVTPSIDSNPSDETSCEAADIEFEVNVSGTNPLQYQWFKNGNALAGENQSTLSLNDLAQTDEGDYSCRVISLLADTIYSAEANLSVMENLLVELTISADETEICTGELVNFSTNATNEGTNPGYIWEINGIDQGVNDASFSSSNLSDEDELSCRLISSESCVVNAEVLSDIIEMTVHPQLDVAVSVSATTTEICSGEAIIFTAAGVNEGSSPVYEWSLNGSSVGGNNAILNIEDLSDGDELSCKLISSESCVTNAEALSESIAVTVHPQLDVAVSISSTTTEICAGENLIFTAVGINEGSSPIYEWSLNGVSVGGNNATLDIGNLSDGDELSCKLISSESCVTNAEALSESVVVTVHSALDVAVSISSSTTEICEGEALVFMATGINEGDNPIYEWSLNGSSVGGNNAILNLGNLLDGDELSCKLVSSEFCVTNTEAYSESIAVTVHPALEVGISISATATEICSGESIVFTAAGVNGGNLATYEWFLNGAVVGGNTEALQLDNLSDGDELICKITSSENCVTSAEATSNMINIEVNDLLEAELNIMASSTNICEGDLINLFAESIHEGDNPVYEWMLNGELLDEETANLSIQNLDDGDEIQCKLISSKTCVVNQEVFSNLVSITVAPLLEVEVEINAGSLNICEGELVQFVATAINGGANPEFTWYLNGVEISEVTANILELNNLVDGDQLYCTLISSESCVVNSLINTDTIVMTVNPQLELGLSIEASATEFCEGEEISFQANVENGGDEFELEWYLNGAALGINDTSFSTALLNDGDLISSVVQSTETCLVQNTDTSNLVMLSVSPNLVPSIEIHTLQDEICQGDTVLFGSVFTNHGINPEFQWFLNGALLEGETSSTLNIYELNNEDEITCSLMSSETCLTENEIFSNSLIIGVKDCSVGLNSLANNEAIKLFPNPSQGIVTIEVDGVKESVNLYIVDLKGIIVYEAFELELSQAKNIQLDLSSLNAGLYFLKLTSSKQVFSKSLFLLD